MRHVDWVFFSPAQLLSRDLLIRYWFDIRRCLKPIFPLCCRLLSLTVLPFLPVTFSVFACTYTVVASLPRHLLRQKSTSTTRPDWRSGWCQHAGHFAQASYVHIRTLGTVVEGALHLPSQLRKGGKTAAPEGLVLVCPWPTPFPSVRSRSWVPGSQSSSSSTTSLSCCFWTLSTLHAQWSSSIAHKNPALASYVIILLFDSSLVY